MKRKPCGRLIKGTANQACTYERAAGKQRCIWHWLMSQAPELQSSYAKNRSVKSGGDFLARVPAEKWPPGERWCSGCQSFIPLFYTTGSRCKACASGAAHGARIEKIYGITSEQYDALLRLQGGVCYICQRRPRTKRLAVDHNHKTGEPRGLLCANNENGCNRGVVANLEAAADGGLAAAQRAVEYLTDPPFKRLQRGERIVGALRVDPVRDDTPPPF